MKFIVKKDRNWHSIIHLIILTIVPTTILIICLVSLLLNLDKILEISVNFLLIFFTSLICSLVTIDYIVWQFKGYEIIEIDQTKFMLLRRGKIFKSKIIIKTSDIISVKECNYQPPRLGDSNSLFNHPFNTSRNIGAIGGKICIEYKEKKRKEKLYFGFSLTNQETRQYVLKMQDYIL